MAAHRELARHDHALVLMNANMSACLRCESTIARGSAIRGARDRIRGRPRRSPILRLTLELVTVGDFALPVARLFVQIKGQSAGTRDLLQAGPCTP